MKRILLNDSSSSRKFLWRKKKKEKRKTGINNIWRELACERIFPQIVKHHKKKILFLPSSQLVSVTWHETRIREKKKTIPKEKCFSHPLALVCDNILRIVCKILKFDVRNEICVHHDKQLKKKKKKKKKEKRRRTSIRKIDLAFDLVV